MSSAQRLRTSLVIPVYNEEDYVEACLQSALAQADSFDEIIVVDNNSTDNTAAIAARFPSVKVLHESRQGVVYARDCGFDAATGDIIARIDGDTRLPVDWSRQLQRIFTDSSISAVSGKMAYYDISAARVLSALDMLIRRYFTVVLGRMLFMQAANMAIRRSAWLATREHVCRQPGMHEDFDLAIHMQQHGHVVCFDERLVAYIDMRQAGGTFWSFCRYFLYCPKTYLLHGIKAGYHMYPVLAVVFLCYPVLKLLYAGYDPVLRQFSWSKLYASSTARRVNPATFVE